MEATLTELRRDTSKVVRPVIHGGEKVTLTDQGEPCAEIVPLRKLDRRAACEALIAIGPVKFRPPQVIYLLDTNVLTEIWKPKPDAAVLQWFFSSEWSVPVPVIAEIQEGAEDAPSAARRIEINAKLDVFLKAHSIAVLDWDAESARTWGRLKHSPEVKRQPQPFWDSLIDAMAVRYGAVVATRDKKDFRHADTFSPWEFTPPESEAAPAEDPA